MMVNLGAFATFVGIFRTLIYMWEFHLKKNQLILWEISNAYFGLVENVI